MITIDLSLLEHIKSVYPNKAEDIYDHIYWIRQYNRFIQVPTPIKDTHVHYEICCNSVELHFEGEDWDEKYKRLIDFLMTKTESQLLLEWEVWNCGYRCYCTTGINTHAQLYEILAFFIKTFDMLIEQFYESTAAFSSITLEEKDILQRQKDVVELYNLSLKEILELPLSIPDYQRIYCWEEKNVKCLLTDLFEHTGIKSRNQYRLGTVILHHNRDRYDIIDGQQRLVTLSLLMHELEVTPKLLHEKITSKESHSYIAYNKYLISQFCRKFLFDKAKRATELLEHVDFSVLVLQNASIDLAYTFFSNTNSRGVTLTDYDLLKAHHLRFIPSALEQQSTRAAATWNKMIEEGRSRIDNQEKPEYVEILDTYIYHLRKWMRKKDIEDSQEYRIKNEYEAAPVIAEIAPFGEKFYFNESIQGGTHFFFFVEQHLQHFKYFAQTEEYKVLHSHMDGESHCLYRNVIEALLYAYYLKFNKFCLTDALVVIMRIILQHRYTNAKARKNSITKYVAQSEIILMLDQATSPTFFLAETNNITKELTFPLQQDMKPIGKRMRNIASTISKNLDKYMVIESFKKINV
ncbi:DUF262 domain-containing protein [Bacteroides sp.]|uniref:DUF262 domain-containing protein n=1 Tax=Bacteroides sp. TaxID=29523 RepID=UPI00262593DB|nr:DUF262 domain-containing protein [Bacteroides sp.]